MFQLNRLPEEANVSEEPPQPSLISEIVSTTIIVAADENKVWDFLRSFDLICELITLKVALKQLLQSLLSSSVVLSVILWCHLLAMLL